MLGEKRVHLHHDQVGEIIGGVARVELIEIVMTGQARGAWAAGRGLAVGVRRAHGRAIAGADVGRIAASCILGYYTSLVKGTSDGGRCPGVHLLFYQLQ